MSNRYNIINCVRFIYYINIKVSACQRTKWKQKFHVLHRSNITYITLANGFWNQWCSSNTIRILLQAFSNTNFKGIKKNRTRTGLFHAQFHPVPSNSHIPAPFRRGTFETGPNNPGFIMNVRSQLSFRNWPRTSGPSHPFTQTIPPGLSGHAFHEAIPASEHDEWDLEWNGCSLQAVVQLWYRDWIILVLCSLYYRFRTVIRCEMKVWYHIISY